MRSMNLDFTPLWRSTVGFDRMLDDAMRWAGDDKYPPYDIERLGEDNYHILMAVAGFSPAEMTITAEPNSLTVEGRKAEKGEHRYLYQGISTRSFRRVFNLAEYVEVTNASLENGLLTIELEQKLPEAMKPRRIEISGAGGAPQIEQKKVD